MTRGSAPGGRRALGSGTTITANSSGTYAGESRYRPYGKQRSGFPTGTDPTTFHFTGQREETTIGLYYYGARWYDPALGRFVQADTIVPSPGNPQALNRYTYAYNSPLRYIDPSGFDPLDTEWQEQFKRDYGRIPTWQDVLIRLLLLAFPGRFNSSAFYSANQVIDDDSLRTILVSSGLSWADMQGGLGRLASYYEDWEDNLFVRDVGTLFAGMLNRFEEPNTEGAILGGVQHLHLHLDSDAGLGSRLRGSDLDRNVHHWAWCVILGNEWLLKGFSTNAGRELIEQQGLKRPDSQADIVLGSFGVAFGIALRVTGPSGIYPVWNAIMGPIVRPEPLPLILK